MNSYAVSCSKLFEMRWAANLINKQCKSIFLKDILFNQDLDLRDYFNLCIDAEGLICMVKKLLNPMIIFKKKEITIL